MEQIMLYSSFIISIINLVVATIPVAFHYFDWRKQLIMTVAENKVTKEKFKLTIVYYNNGYKPMILANSYISLSNRNKVNAFTKDNMFASMKCMRPVMLEGKKHCGIEIEYLISDLSKIEEDIDIHVHTSYVCFEGIYYNDNSIVGMLNRNDEIPIIVSVFHERIKLAKNKSIATMRGYVQRMN